MATPDGGSPGPVYAGEILLGRYRITSRLAEGGHSLIYRAEDERLRRPACVKLLRFPTADPGFRAAIEERFVQEAFLLARLTHPTTLKILDFGYFRDRGQPEAAEIPFQVTELVSGGPLSRWVKRRGKLGAEDLVGVIGPIARALAEVHGVGVAHLDIKPQNILLSRTSLGREPKLADFGIAETMEAKVSGSFRQVLLYSVNWAAPEQMVGDPIGPSSDVYALALVVVYALTGRLVFSEPDPAGAYRLRKASCDALVDAVSGAELPEALIELLVRAVHFEPSLRFADVMEFFHLLEQALAPLRQAAAIAAPATPLSPVTPAGGDESGPAPIEAGGADRTAFDPVTAANLWHLGRGKPAPMVAGRQVSFVPIADSVDLEAGKVRLRVAFVPVGAEQLGVHVKGLNCFVKVAGRRPSSAVTLESSAALEFISGGGETLGGAEVAFSATGPSRTVVSVEGQWLAVPSEECRNLVALDFGPGLTCALLCEPR